MSDQDRSQSEEMKRMSKLADEYEAHMLPVLAKELAAAKAKLSVMRDALESIIARSHSWVITEQTAYIEKPIHDSYRKIAEQALKQAEEKCF